MKAILSSLAALRRIGRASDPAFDRRVMALLIGSIVAGIAEVMSIGSLLPLVAATEGRGASTLQSLAPWLGSEARNWALLFALLVVATAALRLWLSIFSQRQVLEVGHRVAVAVHARVLDQDYSYHARHHSGALIADIEKVERLVYGVGWPLVQAIGAAIVGGAILLLLVGLQPTASFIALVLIGGFYLLLSAATSRRFRRHGKVAAQSYEKRVRTLQDSVGAIRDLLVERRQSYFVDSFARANRAIVDARLGTEMLGNAPRFMIEAVGAVLFASLAVFLAERPGGLTEAIPILAVFALAFVRLLPLIHQLFRGWTNIVSEAPIVEQVAALLSLPAQDHAAATPRPFKRNVTLRAVNFAYDNGDAVAEDLNLEIGRGEWVGLTGPTGGGKSTTGDLLLGLQQPSAGTMEIDGKALGAGDLKGWQKNVAAVSQSVFVADLSVVANIAFAEDGEPDQQRLSEAARIAQLDAWIEGLPNGLQTIVGEAGRRISGGQRQRIGIARALYKQSTFLLLDEATNALDEVTERAFLKDLRTSRPDLAVVIISHREAALAACDRVYRIEGGRATER
jgi:ABC-type multidrug transport system fused ATPase/permease subunit